ncbi:MAG: pantoate--beta-alanine ligase [Pseudomonadota bacterium]
MQDKEPQVCPSPGAVRTLVANLRRQGETIALVPTMGALHAGHLALVEEAHKTASKVIVSIFVNPSQFGPGEDFTRYPRTFDTDLAALSPLGVEAVYAPGIDDMYPEGFATEITLKGPALGLETDFRPHFFTGVATVVAKLLLAVLPDKAIFGEKDYQQLLVIRQMVRDLNIPVEIVGAPTIREDDGLALSSRNQYLSSEERAQATTLIESLKACARDIRSGIPISTALDSARSQLEARGFTVDYVALRNAETLEEVASDSDHAGKPLRLLAAAKLGGTRLIDNIPA